MNRYAPAVVILLALALVAGALAAQGGPSQFELKEKIAIGTDAAGRQWYLGGFSGLYPIGSSGNEYWTLTDRGANDDSNQADTGVPRYCDPIPSPNGKVIFLPGFVPRLIKIGLSQDRIKVQEQVLLHAGATPASGKPNLAPFDEPAYRQTSPAKTCEALVADPLGVDTEGVAVDPRDGSFWVADEYRPSVIHVGSDGEIVSRLVPADLLAETPVDSLATPTLLTATKYAETVAGRFAVEPVFPAIINGFRKNRGFEGIAISPDGRWLYTMLQSPMDIRTAWNTPTTASWIKAASPAVTSGQRDLARRSPYIRVFKVDISDAANPVVAAEWIYLLDHGFQATPPDGSGEADRISEFLWVATDTLVIEERDDVRPTQLTRLFTADFTNATNLLDPSDSAAYALGNAAAVPNILEMLSGAIVLKPTGPIAAAQKNAVPIDVGALLSGAGFVNSKLEGVATVGARGANPALLTVLNDNDFDLDHTTSPALSPVSIPERAEVFSRP